MNVEEKDQGRSGLMFGLYNITTFNSCEDSTDWGKITPKAIKTQGLESFNIGTHRNPSK